MQPLDLYWTEYAKNHASQYNAEMAKFVSDLSTSLRCITALEVGCSAANDLKLFRFPPWGIDRNELAISIAKESLPESEFKVAEADSIPYEDSTFDFVFTVNLLNYVENDTVQPILDEMFRLSKKYIMNIEMFSEDEGTISEEPIKCIGRNIKERWMDYKVKIISNVDMHEEIDPKKSRFTLVRKIQEI